MIYRILTGRSRARHCGCGCDCDSAAVHGPPLLPRLPVPTVTRGAPVRSRLSNLQTTCGAAHAAPSRLAPSGGGASDNQRLSPLYPGPGSLPFDRTVPAIHHPPSAICQRRGAISFPAVVARTLRFQFRPCFARQLRASGTHLHQDLSGRRRGGCPRGAVTVFSLNACAPVLRGECVPARDLLRTGRPAAVRVAGDGMDVYVERALEVDMGTGTGVVLHCRGLWLIFQVTLAGV
ncbi:hypothetical protein C8Q76DRAFT_113107 [Earliella scabrosa]|nr:hypothetical protein C8Q76DRAFT_113107 [Earliella scabrosa]